MIKVLPLVPGVEAISVGSWSQWVMDNTTVRITTEAGFAPRD